MSWKIIVSALLFKALPKIQKYITLYKRNIYKISYLILK
ncbi:hypothetical protein B4113_2231 [Geobacillus sp. B4113_201601]|nr:hypothetical protein B4113_2231 [Geobacillus sp. B4113_201601]